MQTQVVMTVIGKDRPGLVDALAGVISRHDGNWLESRMCHLGGEFAGILRVQVPVEREQALQEALQELERQGLTIVVRVGPEPSAASSPGAFLEIVGHDRPGIVHQISHVLAQQQVNVEELQSERISAPMSGEMLFKARVHLRVPPECDLEQLRRNLERIGGDLLVDVDLKEQPAG